ncbi:MAG: YbaK/EbsC family protein [Bacillota bacterium]|nr:YbaK/EbsC family protein [Bacillota bacterium]
MEALQRVAQFMEQLPFKLEIITFDESTHTAQLAADALGVKEAQIAKTLVFIGKTKSVLVVTSGDQKVDQKKLKQLTEEKMKFANEEQVFNLTGFAPGGVCPFGIKELMPIFIDISLKRFDVVYAAAGTPKSAVPVTVAQLVAATGGELVDVC